MKTKCPEADLLVCCATTCMDAERADRLRALLLKEIDWDYLAQIALAHGVMPLLHRHLDAMGPEAVPPRALERTRDRFHANARRNLFLTAQLLHLLDSLEANGVAAIPYKGPVLAAFAYGDPALRQFGDLDIWIRRDDVSRAMGLLLAQGYRLQCSIQNPKSKIHNAYLRSQCEHHFLRDEGKVAVELQWAIAPRCYGLSLDDERLWERLVPVSLAGTTVRSFSTEDLLLMLCMHGYKHYWERLDWICSVAELVRARPAIDWEQVMSRSHTLSCERILLVGLCLASDLLGVILPGEISQQIGNDAEVKHLAAATGARFFQKPFRPAGTFERFRFHLRARERWRDRMRFCLRRALTPTLDDWAFVSLPDFLFPLYYALRPIRLAGQYGLRLLDGKR